jgi:hypothetical protein
MLTRRWWAWTAPFWFVAVLVGGLWGSFSIPSAYKQECYENKQTHQKDCARYHISLIALREVKESLSEWEPVFVGLGTLAIAAFTYTLWRSHDKLWKATRETIELTRQAFFATHRPKLIVRQLQVDPVLPGHTIKVRCSLINVGSTEATVTFITFQVVLWNGTHWEPPGIDPAVTPVNPRTIRSGQRISVLAESRFHVTNTQIAQIQQGPLVICAVGEITYTDALGVERRTGFRCNYDPSTDMFAASPNQDQEYQD